MQEEKVKEHILKAFYQLSFSYGLKKVTVDMLARECGISKKTIYRIFKSKEEIVDVFTDLVLENVEEQLKTTRIKEENPAVILENFFDFVLSLTGNIPSGVFTDVRRFYPDIEEKIKTVRTRISKQFIEIIRTGVEQNYFRQINMKFIEGFYTGMVHYIFNPDFFLDNDLTIEETLISFKNILLSALLKPEIPGEKIEQKTGHTVDNPLI